MMTKASNEPLRILAINPGATSTKLGVFEGETPLLKKSVDHSVTDLEKFPRMGDQYPYRLALIEAALQEAGIALNSLDAVVGRGGLMNPVPGGVYEVNDAMVKISAKRNTANTPRTSEPPWLENLPGKPASGPSSWTPWPRTRWTPWPGSRGSRASTAPDFTTP